MKRQIIGLLALLAGVTALGLAVIPGIAMSPSNGEPEQAEQEKGVTLRFKKFSVRLGGRKEEAKINQADVQAQKDRKQLLKSFTISAVVCSLIGMILGPISWVREKQPVISVSAMALSCTAILWQYIIIGLILGIALAILLIVLSHFDVVV